jgi:DNA end-binding protein Ku
LRRSVQAEGGKNATASKSAARPPAKKGRKKIDGQKEMLLPISDKKSARDARVEHGKAPRTAAKHRKAG